jgi:Ras-related protein Rab-28
MITNYISGADAVLLCYDITNYESFANLEDWYRLVLRTFYQAKMPYVALLGNKSKLCLTDDAQDQSPRTVFEHV